MNQNSEMTRWTMPTKPEFFALHKSAINLYDTVAVIVQGIWLLFSVSPFAALIEGNVPSVANYALPIAFGLLLYLHYVLHELLRYVFYNQLDNDPNTVNSIMHYAVISVIVLGMFILDLQGTTRFLRKENTYKTERTAEESAHRTDLSELRSRQQSEIALIDNAANADVKAIETAYASRISTTKARRAFDQWDINKRNADSRKLEAERDGKTANRTAQAGEAKSRLLGQHTSERNRLTGNIDHRVATIDAADATNAADSSTYGWVVSLICLLVLLGCTFQCTTLRVSAGQKPVSRFTIADATGSVNNKAFDALQDIWHRVAHQFIANFHHWATSKSRDLDTLDGAFRLKTRDGSAATHDWLAG